MAARIADPPSAHELDRPPMTSVHPKITSPKDMAIRTRLALAKAQREMISMMRCGSIAPQRGWARISFPATERAVKSGVFRQRLGPGVVAVDPVRVGRLAHEGVLLRGPLDAGRALAPRLGKAGEGGRDV